MSIHQLLFHHGFLPLAFLITRGIAINDVPKYCGEPKIAQSFEYSGIAADWVSVFSSIKIHVTYHVRSSDVSWNFENRLPYGINVEMNGCNSSEFPCGKLELGRQSPDARWFYLRSWHLRAPKHYISMLHSDAELILVYSVWDTHRPRHLTKNLDTHIEKLVLVLPLFTNFEGESGERSTLDMSALLQNSEIPELSWLQEALQHPTEHKVLLEQSSQALTNCGRTLKVIKRTPLPCIGLPAMHLTQTGADSVDHVIQGYMSVGQFPRLVWTEKELETRRIFFACIFSALLLLMLLLSAIAVCLNNKSISGRALSRMKREYHIVVDGEVVEGVEHSESLWQRTFKNQTYLSCCSRIFARCTVAGSSPTSVANNPVAKAIVLLNMMLYILMSVGLPFINDIAPVEYIPPAWRNLERISCYYNLPWESHLIVLLNFLVNRCTDILVYSWLPLNSPEVVVCASWKHIFQSVVAKFIFSGVAFCTTWFDVVCVSVVRACGSPLWMPMCISVAVGYSFELLILPAICLTSGDSTTAKALYAAARMHIVMSCIESTDERHKTRNLGKVLWDWMNGLRILLTNLPMSILQTAFLITEEFNALVFMCLLASIASFFYDIICLTMHDMRWTLEEYDKICVRRALRESVQKIKVEKTSKSSNAVAQDKTKILDGLKKAWLYNMSSEALVLEAQKQVSEELRAKQTTTQELAQQLSHYLATTCSQDWNSVHDHNLMLRACISCLELLLSGQGGALLVVCDGSLEMRTQPVDNHCLMRVMEVMCPSGVFKSPDELTCHAVSEAFRHVFNTFCMHTDNDRWDHKAVQKLESRRGEFAELPDDLLKGLLCQPMDGGIVLDQHGKVLHAAVMLNYQQERWVFKKVSGDSVGTRHTCALATAVWLCNQMWPGVVFVRSDAGGLHCIFGGGGGNPPDIWYLSGTGTEQREVIVPNYISLEPDESVGSEDSDIEEEGSESEEVTESSNFCVKASC